MEGPDGRWLASYTRFSKQYELKEGVAKSYMARRFVAGHSVKVIWKGSLDTLMTMSTREKAEVISAARVEEFSKTAATAKPIVIKDSQGAILTLRITALASYIRTLQETDRSPPARPPKPDKRGSHIKTHYAVWADMRVESPVFVRGIVGGRGGGLSVSHDGSKTKQQKKAKACLIS